MSSATTTLEQSSSIESELSFTENREQQLVVHRNSCKLKAARTPLALVGTQRLLSTSEPIKSCSTCQPSQRQLGELASYVQQRVRPQLDNVSELEPCVDDSKLEHDSLSEQQRKLVELRSAGSEIDAFLATAPKRVVELAPDADVVPLTRRGKRNSTRGERHAQRTVEQQQLRGATLQLERELTKRCSDCDKDVKLTSFPTSTKGGARVRLDYCRSCRTARQLAKAAK